MNSRNTLSSIFGLIVFILFFVFFISCDSGSSGDSSGDSGTETATEETVSTDDSSGDTETSDDTEDETQTEDEATDDESSDDGTLSLPDGVTLETVTQDAGTLESILEQLNVICVVNCMFDSTCIEECDSDTIDASVENSISLVFENSNEYSVALTIDAGTVFSLSDDESEDSETTDDETATEEDSTDSETSDDESATDDDSSDSETSDDETATDEDTTDSETTEENSNSAMTLQTRTLILIPGTNVFTLPVVSVTEDDSTDETTDDDSETDDTDSDDTSDDTDTTDDGTSTDDDSAEESDDSDSDNYIIGQIVASDCMETILDMIGGGDLTSEAYSIIQALVWKCINEEDGITDEDWAELAEAVNYEEDTTEEDTTTDSEDTSDDTETES